MLDRVNRASGGRASDESRVVVYSAIITARSADCTKTPASVCARLNRSPCSWFVNTCGYCLPGFLGAPYPANRACFAPSGTAADTARVSYSTRAKSLLDTIFIPGMPGSACVDGSSCISGACVRTRAGKTCDSSFGNKQCPDSGGCSLRGRCVFLGDDDHTILTSCGAYDATCRAVCVCNEGYSGLSCDKKADQQLIPSQTLLAASCSDLSISGSSHWSAAQIAASPHSLYQWMDTLSSLLGDPSLLTHGSYSLCAQAIFIPYHHPVSSSHHPISSSSIIISYHNIIYYQGSDGTYGNCWSRCSSR